MARILIADDDELIAECACEVLLDAGHACGWVTSAEAAWECVQRKRPDILLLDRMMPGQSGLELLRQLRGSPLLYDLPVMMFTTMSGPLDEEQAIYAGAQDFITKPFTPENLVARVARLLKARGDRPRHVDLATVMLHQPARAMAETPAMRRMV